MASGRARIGLGQVAATLVCWRSGRARPYQVQCGSLGCDGAHPGRRAVISAREFTNRSEWMLPGIVVGGPIGHLKSPSCLSELRSANRTLANDHDAKRPGEGTRWLSDHPKAPRWYFFFPPRILPRPISGEDFVSESLRKLLILLATPAGFEPATFSLEGCCSIP